MDIAKTHPIGQDPSAYNDNAYFCGKSASGSVVYSEFSFDLSGIPTNAEIGTVTVVAGGSCETSYFSSYVAQLYCGSTAKGVAGSLRSKTTTYTTTFNGGVWTRDELNDCRIRFTATKSGTGSTRKCYVNGARITVQYTVNNEKFMLKLGGAWHDIARVFKKVNGIWVEQTELASVIEDGVRYKNGGEIVSPYKTVTITGSGSSSWCYVTINGTKYTSAASVKVESGATVQITVGGDVAKYCYVSLDGTNVLSGSGTYTYTVTEDCSMKLAMTVHETYYTCGSVEITTGGGSSANLISFTVDGVSYQAEEGMTWTQFIASSYNQDNYFRDAFGGVYTDDGWVYTSSGVNPTVEDAIIPGEAYYTQ